MLTTKFTSLQDFNILLGETYEYYVVAFDAELELESEASNIVQIVIPAEAADELDPVEDPNTVNQMEIPMEILMQDLARIQ